MSMFDLQVWVAKALKKRENMPGEIAWRTDEVALWIRESLQDVGQHQNAKLVTADEVHQTLLVMDHDHYIKVLSIMGDGQFLVRLRPAFEGLLYTPKEEDRGPGENPSRVIGGFGDKSR